MTKLTKLATVEEALAAREKLQEPWTLIQLTKSEHKGYVLANVHEKVLLNVCGKLFLQGCKLLSEPIGDQSGSFYRVHFSANVQVAGILALMFPCPSDAEPFTISQKGKLLNGMSVTFALEPYTQEVATA